MLQPYSLEGAVSGLCVRAAGAVRCVLIAVLYLVTTSTASAEGAEPNTPENVVAAFENAYRRGDIETAVATWDFHKSAELYREEMFPPFLTLPSNWEAETAGKFERALRDEFRSKAVARFDSSTCTLTGKEKISETLVQLVETCRWADGFESSQRLLTFNGPVGFKGPAGWRLVQYPSIRTYEPVCFRDVRTNILVCSERDGSQVTAVQNGRQLWRKDSHSDWKIHPYRTLYPVVVSMTVPPPGLLDPPSLEKYRRGILITYDSSEFGVLDQETGSFQGLGQN